jgi:hypothetical protein
MTQITYKVEAFWDAEAEVWGSLPFTRGGLGWGKKYLIHQP